MHQGGGGGFHLGALGYGVGYAFAGVLTDDLKRSIEKSGRVPLDYEIPYVDAADQPYEVFVPDWDGYVGQEPLKEQLRVHMASAERRGDRLEHVLLASGQPGVGKTTLARLIAQQMGGRLRVLVPPFTAQTLFDAAKSMRDDEFLFIDEIHKLADRGPAAAENLLHMLEEGVLYLDTGAYRLARFTVIGATTEPDKLPETIVDRFPIKPYFQPYSLPEMVRIVHNFTKHYDVYLLPTTLVGLAKASRGTPRVARDLVMAARDLAFTLDRAPITSEVLAFKEVDNDGMTRVHKAYITAMYKWYGREDRHGNKEYVAGEATMMSMLRETKQGIARIERFLVERGLLDRTPRGRRLTVLGIERAQEWARESTE